MDHRPLQEEQRFDLGWNALLETSSPALAKGHLGGGALSLGPVLAVGHLQVSVGLSSFVVREQKWGDHGATRPTRGPASHP